MTASTIYKIGVGVIFGTLVAGGLIDVGLAMAGAAFTITDWLRGNPGYYWTPAALLAVFLVGLALHLFVFVE